MTNIFVLARQSPIALSIPRSARKVLPRQDRRVKKRTCDSSLLQGGGFLAAPFAKRMPAPICCQNPGNLVNPVKSSELTRYSAALRLTRSLPVDFATLHPSGCLRQSFSLRSIILPFGPTCGWSISTFPKGLDSVNRPPPCPPWLIPSLPRAVARLKTPHCPLKTFSDAYKLKTYKLKTPPPPAIHSCHTFARHDKFFKSLHYL